MWLIFVVNSSHCVPLGVDREETRFVQAHSVTLTTCGSTKPTTMKCSMFETLSLCLLVAGFIVSAGTGCTLWDRGVWSESTGLWGLNNSSDNANPQKSAARRSVSKLTQQSRDTISLSVEFRHVPSTALGETMWRSIDETAFDARVRQAWLANGLRIGLLHDVDGGVKSQRAAEGGQLADPVNELFAGAKVLGGQPDGREVIPLRPSRRHELPLSPALGGNTTVLLQDSSGLMGRALDAPQLLLAITAENGVRHGQSRIQIRPEIQHGAVRQKFISSEAAVRIQAGRDCWELSQLDLTWTTQPGAILVIAPVVQPSESEPTFGLGRQMLRDTDHLLDDQHIVAFLQIEKP